MTNGEIAPALTITVGDASLLAASSHRAFAARVCAVADWPESNPTSFFAICAWFSEEESASRFNASAA